MDKKLVTILVVEDDDALREAICDALAFADFQTLPTADGKEALAVLHGQHKIDLVLTDVEMPELGGLDLLTEHQIPMARDARSSDDGVCPSVPSGGRHSKRCGRLFG